MQLHFTSLWQSEKDNSDFNCLSNLISFEKNNGTIFTWKPKSNWKLFLKMRMKRRRGKFNMKFLLNEVSVLTFRLFCFDLFCIKLASLFWLKLLTIYCLHLNGDCFYNVRYTKYFSSKPSLHVVYTSFSLTIKQRENYFESRFPAFPVLIAKMTRNVITD